MDTIFEMFNSSNKYSSTKQDTRKRTNIFPNSFAQDATDELYYTVTGWPDKHPSSQEIIQKQIRVIVFKLALQSIKKIKHVKH